MSLPRPQKTKRKRLKENLQNLFGSGSQDSSPSTTAQESASPSLLDLHAHSTHIRHAPRPQGVEHLAPYPSEAPARPHTSAISDSYAASGQVPAAMTAYAGNQLRSSAPILPSNSQRYSDIPTTLVADGSSQIVHAGSQHSPSIPVASAGSTPSPRSRSPSNPITHFTPSSREPSPMRRLLGVFRPRSPSDSSASEQPSWNNARNYLGMAKGGLRIGLRLGAVAADSFPPAKAVIAGLQEILQIAEVSASLIIIVTHMFMELRRLSIATRRTYARL